jgi:hypothetical protein
LNMHQHKKGTIELGGHEYAYEHWERDWNILENTELENAMYTSLNGTLHEVVVEHSGLDVTFPDGKKVSTFLAAGGKSFEDCLERIHEQYLFYECAKESSSFEEAKQKWYKKLGV